MTPQPLNWFDVVWPRELDSAVHADALRLLATTKSVPVVLEAVGTSNGVVHRLGLPASKSALIVEQLRAAMPAVAFTRLGARPPLVIARAVDVRISQVGRALRTDLESTSRALLTALAAARVGESLVLQWQLVGALAAQSVGSTAYAPSSGRLLSDVARVITGGKELDADDRGALRTKRSQPGWRVVGRIGVQAGHAARQRQLIEHLLAALRNAEAPGVQLHVKSVKPSSLITLSTPWRTSLRLNADELAAVSSWPVGDTRTLSVRRQTIRSLGPSNAMRTRGRVVGVSTFPNAGQSVAIDVRDSLRGLHVLGPTGTGKSTLLLNLIAQDMAAGRAVVVVEPKGDLIADVLARVPAERKDDVVLVDPTDPKAVVGINPLANPSSPELVADQLLGIFHQQYAASWGPRTSDILYASLLTLARTKGMSLACVPLLLGDAAFRRRLVGKLDEPVVLQPFWQMFDAWSEAERSAATAPVLNKVRPLLVRPSLRAVLGQASPRFQLRRLFTERKILLVNLAKGLMGPEAAALLGGVLVGQLWQTALERSAIAPESRRPTFVFMDEFQDYLNLPTDLADALAQARGLGIGLTLAHQHLGQLNPQMRSAVLSNARSRILFQVAADDARTFAQEAQLNAEDLRSLGAFEAYAQLFAADAVQPWLSLRTLPAPKATTDAEQIRARSREQYAIPIAQVDEALQRLRHAERQGDLGPRRRGGGER